MSANPPKSVRALHPSSLPSMVVHHALEVAKGELISLLQSAERDNVLLRQKLEEVVECQRALDILHGHCIVKPEENDE